jgi:ubiquinone/menaquinone biosynthesis C-methylase UbiE
LDVATGTGWAALAAAQHVGPTGRALGVDLAPELLEHARQKAAAAGLTHVEFRAGDATRLDLADQCVNVVLCASALFFLPDMLAALREWHRVLTPGAPGGIFGVWANLPPAPAGLVEGAPAAVWGLRAHVITGPATGRAGDVSAVTA